jgi:hypothetical protein
MKARFSHVRWSGVLLTSTLVIMLAVLLNTVLLLLASSVWGPRTVIVLLVASWSTSILTILLTVGAAVWVGRKVEREAPLHGLLIGLVAALILFIFNPLLTDFFQGAYRGRLDLLVAALAGFFLIVAAGWLGGVLSSRGQEKP